MSTGAELLKKEYYQIISGRTERENIEYFQEQINNHLRVGWKLHGDIFFLESFGETKYTTINQAIIKSNPQQ